MSFDRPENELLVCIARQSLDPVKAERVRRLLDRDLDWGYILENAHQHSLIPLLYHHIKNIAPEAVPEAAMAKLEGRYQRSTTQGFVLTSEMLKILDVFEEHDVPVVAFKGPTLALSAYTDVGLRQFSDLDLLVHKRDVHRVRDLLVERGFKADPDLSTGQESALLKFDCACNFRSDAGVVFDVHWGIASPYSGLEFDVERIWRRAEPVAVGGKQVLAASPEDHLLIVSLHGFTHLWERLGWVCDVAALIERNPKLDWDFVLTSAKQDGTFRILLLGLNVAHTFLEARLPAEVLEVVQSDPVVQKLTGELQDQLFEDRTVGTGMLGETMLHVRMRERTQDGLKSCYHLLTAPRINDWTSISLPPGLFFLYYVLRPIRIAGRLIFKRGENDGQPG